MAAHSNDDDLAFFDDIDNFFHQPGTYNPVVNQAPESQQNPAPEVQVPVNRPLLPAQAGFNYFNYQKPTDQQTRDYKEHIKFLLHRYQPDPNNGFDPTFHRPSITYHGLCALAIWNSPSGYVTTQDVYRFCRHHFPYFRTAKNFTSSIRHVLYEKANEFAVFQNGEGRQRQMFFTFAEGASIETLLRAGDRTYMDSQDPRTSDYTNLLLHRQDLFLWIPEQTNRGVKRRQVHDN